MPACQRMFCSSLAFLRWMISYNLTNRVDAPYPALVTLNPFLACSQ
jgi:hypothetical protein